MKRSVFTYAAMIVAALAGCGTDNTNTNKCAAVTCASGQTCNAATGVCETPNKCAAVTCGAGQMCNAATGVCETTNKCAAVTCTMGLACDMNTGMCANPPVPTLAALIDRMGRPAVNTALTNPYDLVKNNQGTVETMGDTTKDNYNKDANSAAWTASWGNYIRQNLGVLDGLDAGVAGVAQACGNQFAADVFIPNVTTKRYDTLSLVLSGDALHVDTTKTTCAQYLAAEVSVVRSLQGMAALNDCGGRQLSYDVIDTTYSALTIGMLTGVNDGIAQTKVPSATFPFFLP